MIPLWERASLRCSLSGLECIEASCASMLTSEHWEGLARKGMDEPCPRAFLGVNLKWGTVCSTAAGVILLILARLNALRASGVAGWVRRNEQSACLSLLPCSESSISHKGLARVLRLRRTEVLERCLVWLGAESSADLLHLSCSNRVLGWLACKAQKCIVCYLGGCRFQGQGV